MGICTQCGKEVLNESVGCENCEGKKAKLSSEEIKSRTNKTYILIGVSVLLLAIALYLLLANKFWFYIDNISYYKSQYNYTKSMSGGWLGGHYSFIASEWKELYNQALACILIHSIGAIVFSITGGIGLYKGIHNLKTIKETCV